MPQETFLQRFPFRYYNIEDIMTMASMFFEDTTCVSGLTKEEDEFEDNATQNWFWFISKSAAMEYTFIFELCATA